VNEADKEFMNEPDTEIEALSGRRLVLLGVGNVALALKAAAAAASYREIVGTTRSTERTRSIDDHGVKSFLLSLERNESIRDLFEGADVLVSFPPERQSDEALSQLAQSARKIVYISSTGVYGKTSGIINERSSVDPEFPHAAARLHAEKIWREQGAIILRAPGIYGPKTGLHIRLRDLSYRLPGDGRNHISRIHLDDLAQIVLASFARGQAGSLYVVGDQAPVPQIEVVSWLCEKMALPMPPSVPIDEVSPTLRGNRQIIADKVLKELDLRLLFPSYKEGFSQCLAAEPAR
jgi:hypothetical protein